MIINNRPHLLVFILFFILLANNFYTQEIVFQASSSEVKLPTTVGALFFSPPTDKPAHLDKIAFDKIGDGFILTFQEGREVMGFKNTDDFNNPQNFYFQKIAAGYINFLNTYGTADERVYMYAKNSRKKFFALKYNLLTKAKVEKEIDFKVKGEKYLGDFSHNQHFYIITWIKKSRVLKLHQWDMDLNLSTKTIDLTKGTYYEKGKLKTKLPPIRVNDSEGIPRDPLLNFEKTKIVYPPKIAAFEEILMYQPNPNAIVTKLNKLYVIDDKLLLSLEKDALYSSLIEIDLTDFSVTTKLLDKYAIGGPREINDTEKSNSYLLNNLLFSIRGDKEEVGLRVYDNAKSQFIGRFSFNNDTPYYSETNTMVNAAIIARYKLPKPDHPKDENIKKRLRKIMTSGNDIGLQVVDIENTYRITIGGYLYAQGTGGGFGGPGGFGGASGGFSGMGAMGLVYFNHTFERDESLNLYLDKETLELSYSDFDNPYTKMNDFLNEAYNDKADKKIGWKVKFKIGTDYYLGYLDKERQTYYIRKFN